MTSTFAAAVAFIESRLAEGMATKSRRVKGMLVILGRCADCMDEPDRHPNGLVSPRAVLARHIIMDMAAIWAGHPEFGSLDLPAQPESRVTGT